MNKDMFLNRFNLYSQPQYHPQGLSEAMHLRHKKLRQAAVLIPLIEREDKLHIILTHRAAHLKHHPNQVSFPGGKTEPQDSDAWATASREANEEIGLPSTALIKLGQLPTLATVSAFHVTPVIGLIHSEFTPQIDPNEVQSLFEVPLDFLLNPRHIHQHEMRINGHIHTVFSMPYQGHFIWGITAQILYSLHLQLRNIV